MQITPKLCAKSSNNPPHIDHGRAWSDLGLRKHLRHSQVLPGGGVRLFGSRAPYRQITSIAAMQSGSMLVPVATGAAPRTGSRANRPGAAHSVAGHACKANRAPHRFAEICASHPTALALRDVCTSSDIQAPANSTARRDGEMIANRLADFTAVSSLPSRPSAKLALARQPSHSLSNVIEQDLS